MPTREVHSSRTARGSRWTAHADCASDGASDRSRPRSTSSRQNPPGISVVYRDTVPRMCVAVRAPTTTETTDGCRSGEGDRSVGQRDAVLLAGDGKRPSVLEHIRRGGPVVVVRVVGDDGCREEPRIVDRSGDDADATSGCRRQQILECSLLVQGVPSRKHDHIEIGAFDEPRGHRGLVHARSDGPDDALLPQLHEGRDRAVEGLRLMLVRVVHVDDVDPIGPETLEALLEGSAAPRRGEKSHTRRWSAGTANPWSSSRSAVSGLGTSSRPTLVDTTYSARGRPASAAPSLRSDRPRP